MINAETALQSRVARLRDRAPAHRVRRRHRRDPRLRVAADRRVGARAVRRARRRRWTSAATTSRSCARWARRAARSSRVLLLESLMLAAPGLALGLVVAHGVAAHVGVWLPAATPLDGRRLDVAAARNGRVVALALGAGIMATCDSRMARVSSRRRRHARRWMMPMKRFSLCICSPPPWSLAAPARAPSTPTSRRAGCRRRRLQRDAAAGARGRGLVEDACAGASRSSKDGKMVAEFSHEILGLDQKDVHVQGFIIPLDIGDKQKRFLLSAVPPHCPFCLPAGPDAIVEVDGEDAGQVRVRADRRRRQVRRAEGRSVRRPLSDDRRRVDRGGGSDACRGKTIAAIDLPRRFRTRPEKRVPL